MLIFETQRLHLRPLGKSDEALYCDLYTDTELMRHIGAPLTVEAALRSFRVACRLATRDGVSAQRWVLLEQGSPAAIGMLSLIADQADSDEAEVGLMLRAHRQRRGVAVAAIGAVADRVFTPADADDPDLRLIWSRHAPGNVAAARLMLRMGFLRQPTSGPGQAEVRWQMTRDRWKAGRLAVGNGKA